MKCPYTRAQLLERDNKDFGEGHLEAVRGIWTETGWWWGQGVLHDQMAAELGGVKILARFRKQYGWAARVEFEPGAGVGLGLTMLMQGTGITGEDRVDVEWPGGRGLSIGEVLSRF